MRWNVFNRTEAERLISALFGGAVLLAGVSAQAAEEPRHLEAEVPLSLANAESRCAPALVRAGEICGVGDSGQVGAATLRPILISGDDAVFGYGKPMIQPAGGRVVLHVPAMSPAPATSTASCSMPGRTTAGAMSTSPAGSMSSGTGCRRASAFWASILIMRG